MFPSKIVFVLGFCFTSLLFSCNPTIKQENTTTDTAAVATLLQTIAIQENKDFYKKDLAAWSNHFVQSEAVYWICVEDNVTLRATGWNDLQQFVAGWMKENPNPESDSLLLQDKIEDFKTEISGSLAFVRYKKLKKETGGVTKVILENRVFKQQNNQWKILGMVSAPGYNTPSSSPNVFVHEQPSK